MLFSEGFFKVSISFGVTVSEGILNHGKQGMVVDHFQVVLNHLVGALGNFLAFTLVLVRVFRVKIEKSVAIASYANLQRLGREILLATDASTLRNVRSSTLLFWGASRFSRSREHFIACRITGLVNGLLNAFKRVAYRWEGIKERSLELRLEGSISAFSWNEQFPKTGLKGREHSV